MAANAFQLDRFWAMDQSVRLSERVVLVSGEGEGFFGIGVRRFRLVRTLQLMGILSQDTPTRVEHRARPPPPAHGGRQRGRGKGAKRV